MSTDLGELVNLLTVGINASAVYFRGHPRVVDVARDFSTRLTQTLDAAQREDLFLGVARDRLVHDGRPLFGPTLIAKRLIDAVRRFRAGGLLLRRGLGPDEAAELFALCAEPKIETSSLEDTRRVLVGRGITHVVLSPPYGEPGWLGEAWACPDGAPFEGALQRASDGMVPVYQTLLETVETTHDAARGDAGLDLDLARGVSEQMAGILAERPAQLLYLTRYPDYDSYTFGHSVRVALLAVLVGQRIQLPLDVLVELGTAGLLHDVGKSRLPHEVMIRVLYKKGPLDAEEQAAIRRHSALGAEALLQTQGSSTLGITAALCHHIRHDDLAARSYPTIGPWFRRSRLTSLIQVCDVFEALTARRPYRPRLTPRRAYEIMLSDAVAYDPSALREFIRAVGIYPPGHRVRLSTGEEGLVLRAGSHPARPVVELETDASGRPLEPERRAVLDLASPDAAGRSVRSLIADDVDPVPATSDPESVVPPEQVLLDCGHDHRPGEPCPVAA